MTNQMRFVSVGVGGEWACMELFPHRGLGQIQPATILPLKKHLTANMPPMMATGSLKWHKLCWRRKRVPRCTTSAGLMNGPVSDMRLARSAPPLISSARCSAPNRDGNSSQRLWMGQMSNGGLGLRGRDASQKRSTGSGKIYLYFFKSGNRIKIGISRQVQQRLSTIGLHLSRPPKLIGCVPGSFALEKFVHAKLSEHKLRGEWFADCHPVRHVISDLVSRGPSAIGFSEELAAKSKKPPFVPAPLTREDSLRARREIVALMFPDNPLRGVSEFLEQSEEQCKRWLDGTDVMPRPLCYALGGRLMEYIGGGLREKFGR